MPAPATNFVAKIETEPKAKPNVAFSLAVVASKSRKTCTVNEAGNSAEGTSGMEERGCAREGAGIAAIDRR